MRGRYYLPGRTANPLVQVASLLVLGVGLVGAVLMGALLLTLLFGVAVVAAVAFTLRVWWLRRRMARRVDAEWRGDAGRVRRDGGDVIDAEYTVVYERETRRRD